MKAEPAGEANLERLAAFCEGHLQNWSASQVVSFYNQLQTQVLLQQDGEGEIILVAFLLVISQKPLEVEIVDIWVSEGCRQQGLASGFLKEYFVLHQPDSVFLEVAVTNEPALTLYEKMNFRRVGKRPRYYTSDQGDRVDALVMQWTA